MGCRAQPVRYPISRTVQQMTRETRMGQPSYTEFRILPATLAALGADTAHDPSELPRPRTKTKQVSTPSFDVRAALYGGKSPLAFERKAE